MSEFPEPGTMIVLEKPWIFLLLEKATYSFSRVTHQISDRKTLNNKEMDIDTLGK